MRILFISILMMLSNGLLAEIYKCPNPSGGYIWSDRLCHDGEMKVGNSWVSVKEEMDKRERERLAALELQKKQAEAQAQKEK